METPKHSSQDCKKNGCISGIICLILSSFSEMISHPLKSGLIYFIAGLIPAAIVGWILFPMALYSKTEQPIDFNHMLHMDPDTGGVPGNSESEQCLYCHEIYDDGEFAGIPKNEKCITCHDSADYALGETDEEKKYLEYISNGEEVPWLSYYRQPDCVYFSHIAHIRILSLHIDR